MAKAQTRSMFWLALHCCNAHSLSLSLTANERPENILWSFVVDAVQRSNNNNNNRCVVWSNACECGNPVKNHVLLNLVDDDGDGGVGGSHSAFLWQILRCQRGNVRAWFGSRIGSCCLQFKVVPPSRCCYRSCVEMFSAQSFEGSAKHFGDFRWGFLPLNIIILINVWTFWWPVPDWTVLQVWPPKRLHDAVFRCVFGSEKCVLCSRRLDGRFVFAEVTRLASGLKTTKNQNFI